MKLPEFVIFDMDGLIFDTERLFMNMKHRVLIEYGYPARDEDYLQTIGLAGELLYEKLHEIYGSDYPADEISSKTRAAVNQYMEEHGPDVKPGITQLLSYLKEQNIPCCVASSSPHAIVEKYLRLANLDGFFRFIIGGEEVSRSKPNPDIFLKALSKAGMKPEQAMVLEDSENGIRAACAAQIPAICIPDLKQPSPEIREMSTLVLASAELLLNHWERY